jgi:hypothetical protein
MADSSRYILLDVYYMQDAMHVFPQLTQGQSYNEGDRMLQMRRFSNVRLTDQGFTAHGRTWEKLWIS